VREKKRRGNEDGSWRAEEPVSPSRLAFAGGVAQHQAGCRSHVGAGLLLLSSPAAVAARWRRYLTDE